MFPKEYFSHPRIASFCHRTRIWRDCESIEELSILLDRLLPNSEKKRFVTECAILNRRESPPSIDIYSPHYPSLLKEIYDPPLVLSYLGDLTLLGNHMIAIVGTRKASKISMLATHFLVVNLKVSDPQICIVSGMALGIDRKAFESALDCDMGVIGVLGTSIQEEYPPGNRDLYLRIKNHPKSLLLSEFIFPTEPARWTFPKRNRLISGLVTDVCIMESGKKSGTLSTAMSAISQNREIHVFDHELQFDNEGGKILLSEGAEILDWKLISENYGRIEKPEFYSDKKEITPEEWKKIAEAERIYKRNGKKTPLGRGAYFVEFT